MSHYDTLILLFLSAVVLVIFLSVCGAYQKGCRDTWHEADEMVCAEPQTEPLLPLARLEDQDRREQIF